MRAGTAGPTMDERFESPANRKPPVVPEPEIDCGDAILTGLDDGMAAGRNSVTV